MKLYLYIPYQGHFVIVWNKKGRPLINETFNTGKYFELCKQTSIFKFKRIGPKFTDIKKFKKYAAVMNKLLT